MKPKSNTRTRRATYDARRALIALKLEHIQTRDALAVTRRDLNDARQSLEDARARLDKLEAVAQITRTALVLAVAYLEGFEKMPRSACREAVLEAAYLAVRMKRP
jgi:septal ring factor EnvC (AmiA/AmiB activator)